MSTNSRIYSLLEIVDLKERIILGNEEIEEQMNKKIDFKKVNRKLEEFRNESKEWLLNSITWN
jgi:hypothetical protein